MQENISLACTVCKRRNYTTTKNKKTTTEKLELAKYCRFCRKHTAHKEGKSSEPLRRVAQLVERRSPKP